MNTKIADRVEPEHISCHNSDVCDILFPAQFWTTAFGLDVIMVL